MNAFASARIRLVMQSGGWMGDGVAGNGAETDWTCFGFCLRDKCIGFRSVDRAPARANGKPISYAITALTNFVLSSNHQL